MADGFLGRWSRRKLDGGEGKADDAQPVPAEPVSAAVDPGVRRDDSSVEPPAPVAPTLEDANALTAASDFKRFMASDVAPEVKNAAMKKLFADPHFNVMDGLDTYIDDYSKADPIPPAMLRQLASAKFLGLFDDEQEQDKAGARDVADDPPAQSVAQSDATQEGPLPPHADADLRLQSDHAPPGKDPGSGTQ